MPASSVSAPLTKTVSFTELKSLDDEQGIFEGYLSVFGNVDSYKDIVEPGAFSKTINDARGRGGKYLFPVLWQHDSREPIGGFLDMKEDRRGLYVQAQLDVNTPLGARAYSGLKMGYLDGLSIGYDTIKHKYVSDIRHLLEIRMWEGSVVTFPANDATRVSSVKAACGDTSFPIGPRSDAWDGSAASAQIATWAKADDGTLDAEKMKSTHLQLDGDPQNSGSYSYPFCIISSGSPQISVAGVIACAGALSGARGADAGGDASAMQAKVSTLYGRINEKYPDATALTPPWEAASKDDSDKDPDNDGDDDSSDSSDDSDNADDTTDDSNDDDRNKHRKTYHPPSTRKDDGCPRDFVGVMSDQEPQQVMEEFYDLMGALVTVIMENLAQAGSVGNDPSKAAISTCLDQFSDAVLDWVDDALYIDLCQPSHPPNDGDDDADDQPDDDSDGDMSSAGAPDDTKNSPLVLAHFAMGARAVKWATRSFVKEGRTISATNKTLISNALSAITDAVEKLQTLVGDDDNQYDPGDGESNPPNSQSSPGKDATGPIDPVMKDEQKPDATSESQSEEKDEDVELEDLYYAFKLLRLRQPEGAH